MRNVLLVEDDPIIARLTQVVLSRGGWTVEHVATGLSAISALAQKRYAFVVLDLGLPEIDGAGVVAWLRAYEARHDYARTPVLVASARCELGPEGSTLDVDGVLQKPISMTALSSITPKEPRRDDRTH